MLKTSIAGCILAAVFATAAYAEVHEVRMLNRGEGAELMVFEPDFLRVAPGDSVKFLATDRGHNAAAIGRMTPKGAEVFTGQINEEIEVVFDVEGLWGIKCTPHFAMGMVMTVAVGDVDKAPRAFLSGRIPPKAKARFTRQLKALGF